jgi:hypothetical protein
VLEVSTKKKKKQKFRAISTMTAKTAFREGSENLSYVVEEFEGGRCGVAQYYNRYPTARFPACI